RPNSQSSQPPCRQNSLPPPHRPPPLHPIMPVRTRHIEQYCLQARAGRPEIIDGINVTDIEALLGANIHFAQCSLKNLSPRLLTSKQARTLFRFTASSYG